jgi:glycosyltransferase involved in cell wall biosynthesis
VDEVSFIVHSHLRWNFVWQRPQQILSRLARAHRILFIEEPLDAPADARLELSEPHPNLIRAVPLLPRAADLSVERQYELILPMLRRALRDDPLLAGRFERFVQWFYSPMPAPCTLQQLAAVAVVYDCMDELSSFRFAPSDIAERERSLLANADVVFTGGHHLYEAKSRLHANVHFYGCGVDAQHFGQARSDRLPVLDDIARLPGPVLGYFGVIDERLDYDLLELLAASFPHASIAMVGPLAKVETNQLPRRKNIHWLGQRAYAELPAVVKGFDVCLMPFAMNAATRYINPTKTLEYMAAGKPIISTAVPDVIRNFTPIVAVAHSPQEFVAEVASALTHCEPARIAQGLARAESAGWDAIVASMRAHIAKVLVPE